MPTAFNKELERLRSSLAQMGGAVEWIFDAALTSLRTGDTELADKAIDFDREINQQENNITNKTILLIATNQPVAGDLRFLAGTLHIAGDLERIGDLSVNLSNRAKNLAKVSPKIVFPDDLNQLAAVVRSMLSQALNALANRDIDHARAIIKNDDEADELHWQIRRRIIKEIEADGSRIHWGLELINVGAYLERLGDHTTNLAEDVIYIYSGHNVRHFEPLPGNAN